MESTALLLIEVGGLLLVLSILGRIANRIGVSPIPLYLIAGLFVGDGSLIPLRESMDFFHIGSEIGVILLLVMLGLEYSPTELVKGLRQAKFSGLWDLLLNALPGAAFALLMGWGPVAAVVFAGITWVSSSGVVAKVLRDLKRLGNRETPTILSVLVIEDLAMAFYLPIVSAIVIGEALSQAAITVAIAVIAVLLILFIALRFGKVISRIFSLHHLESLLLGVLGLTMLVGGLSAELKVSTAVGAFLVGIAITGQVAEEAVRVLGPIRDVFATVFFVYFGIVTSPATLLPVVLPALALAAVTIGTKVLTGYLAARAAGVGVAGRWRAGFALTPRGEFSIVIAGLAATALSAGNAQVAQFIVSTTTAYVLITIIAGPLLARIPDTDWFKGAVRRRAERRARLQPE
ncbi:MAG: cation/H(+) antiporter [Micrococcales bacterium 73-13]|nr:MAG: cation/H(+) antiporter [Micrococcales bacterium 73-13]